MKDFYLQIYDRARNFEPLSINPRFHDISDIFDNYEKPFFIDWAHTSETGNEVVAKRMYIDVLKIMNIHLGE